MLKILGTLYGTIISYKLRKKLAKRVQYNIF